LELLYLRAVDTNYPLDDRIIKGIWDCCTRKHEEVQRASWQIFQELVQYSKPSLLAEFWKLIRELKNSEVGEMHVVFLKRYHEGVFK
jgi:thymidylate synthase ThyX